MSTTDGVVVRDARDDERDAIAHLTHAAYAQYATAMTPSAWAGLEQAMIAGLASTEPADRIVAEREGVLIGAVMLYHPSADAYDGIVGPSDWPEIRLLAVTPAARGLGVGPLLVHACIARARAMGAAVLGLHTSRSMGAAIAMYTRMGFARAPAYDFQPEGAELVEGYALKLH